MSEHCCGHQHCDSAAPASAPPPTLSGATRLRVQGLCCDSEIALVHRRLDGLPGVQQVVVDLVGGIVSITHDPAPTGVDELIAALEGAGLSASRAQAGVAAVAPTPLPWGLLASGVLLAGALLSAWWPPAAWLALGAIAAGAGPILKKAWIALQNRLLDMNVLMTLAVLGALGLGEWVEGAAVVFLFAVSEWLEARSMDRARAAMHGLADLVPSQAQTVTGDLLAVDAVAVGTLLAIKPGERVPLDGVVVSGHSAVDESTLTGESLPVDKGEGDTLSAGTLNTSGYLELRTTAPSTDSAVARLVRMVSEASAARSQQERFVDRFARVYTPAVVVGALLLASLPPLALGADPHTWLYRAIVLLVVACPCALVISTPVAIVSALARAARSGVLIKGGVHLETLGRIRALALDKTGTLTEGRFQVVDCLPMNGVSAEALHRALSAAESGSSHPLAAALVDHGGVEAPGRPQTYETIEGQGIVATVDGRQVAVGNHQLAERMGWHDDEEHALLERWMAEGRTVVYVGIDGVLAGLHSLADLPRAEAASAVSALRGLGLEVAMLTGDNAGTAEAVRSSVGLSRVLSELRPEDKVAAIRGLAGPVAMVGDGINDAPALAAADVGIAMGVGGTAVAMETADVALLTSDLRALPKVIALGRRALRVIRLNIAFAIALKALVLVLAVAGFASLWLAVAADVGTTLLVVLHSLSLLRDGPQFAASAD